MKSAKNGGLGIQDPLKTAAISYSISKEGTEILSDAIKSGNKIDIQNHVYTMKAVIANKKKLKQKLKPKKLKISCPYFQLKDSLLSNGYMRANVQAGFPLCLWKTINLT